MSSYIQLLSQGIHVSRALMPVPSMLTILDDLAPQRRQPAKRPPRRQQLVQAQPPLLPQHLRDCLSQEAATSMSITALAPSKVSSYPPEPGTPPAAHPPPTPPIIRPMPRPALGPLRCIPARDTARCTQVTTRWDVVLGSQRTWLPGSSLMEVPWCMELAMEDLVPLLCRRGRRRGMSLLVLLSRTRLL